MAKLCSVAGLALAVLVPGTARCSTAGQAPAQTIDELNARLDAIAPRVRAALNDETEAPSVVQQLDSLELDFARIVSKPNTNPSRLRAAFDRIEQMLSEIHDYYRDEANSTGCFVPLRLR